jgi:hypothetical protein
MLAEWLGSGQLSVSDPTDCGGELGTDRQTDIPAHLPFIRDWLGFPDSTEGRGGMTSCNSN